MKARYLWVLKRKMGVRPLHRITLWRERSAYEHNFCYKHIWTRNLFLHDSSQLYPMINDIFLLSVYVPDLPIKFFLFICWRQLCNAFKFHTCSGIALSISFPHDHVKFLCTWNDWIKIRDWTLRSSGDHVLDITHIFHTPHPKYTLDQSWGGISSSVLSVFFNDKFYKLLKSLHLIGWEQICQWKTLTKCLMKCPPRQV